MLIKHRYRVLGMQTTYLPEGGTLQVVGVIWIFFAKLGE